jgi:ABC-type nitrate/sulfonate/bicarbonate transport system substrate-binding protein
MRLTLIGKLVAFLIVCGVLIGGYRYWQQTQGGKSAQKTNSGTETFTAKVPEDIAQKSLLGRPLRVGVVTWPGYMGGIVANNGFKPNQDSLYFKNHNLLVEFALMEDADARSKALANGAVDFVWSTVDFLANEAPGFLKGGTPVKAVMQVDWSRGGDAIVANDSIKKIEDLKGKKISLALFTPSHWFLESSLENSSLDENDQSEIMKSLVGVNASPDARQNFTAGKVDAAVVWEPDVTQALKERQGSHIVISSKTAANLIADLMIAREDFVRQHPDVVKAFIAGWMDGTEAANRNPNHTAELLMENEPLYQELGQDETLKNLTTVRWADLGDNAKMFGLGGGEPLFDRIFKQASRAWVKRGYISSPIPPEMAKDVTALRSLYSAMPNVLKPVAPKEEFTFKKPAPAEKKVEKAVMTKPVNIYFPSNLATLDPNAKALLDDTATTIQTYSNAYIRIEGNSARTGHPTGERQLSQRRAQAVVNYLVNRYGFNRNRFIAVGNGSKNATGTDSARDRRTDITILPRS